MKIINSFLVFVISLIYHSFVIADSPVAQKFQLKQITNFEICQNNSNTCITDDTVLRDLYPKQNIQIIHNIGMIENKILVSIIGSVKFNDGKDTYAIFLSQSNQIDGKQGIPTCHACGANLGIAIYQFHNKWKLFGIVNNIEEMGSFGYISVDKSLLNIYSSKSERFFITLNSSSMHQGYGGEYSHIFEVNSDFL